LPGLITGEQCSPEEGRACFSLALILTLLDFLDFAPGLRRPITALIFGGPFLLMLFGAVLDLFAF
jgi:hypothetical protein